jgi:CBS domain-containing protein
MRCPDCSHTNIAGAETCEACHAPLGAPLGPQPHQGLSRRILSGSLHDLSPRKSVSVRPDSSVSDAVRLMRKNGTGCVLVDSEGGGAVAGILTERDILLRVAGLKDPTQVKVREIMHPDPLCLKHDEPVSHAFHHMSVGRYRHIPVHLADGSLGLISARDLLSYLTG